MEEGEGGGGFSLPNPFAKRAEAKEVSGVGTDVRETWSVAWCFSGTWPLPHRPRVRVIGECVMTTAGGERAVVSLEDTWLAPTSAWGLVTAQVLPRLNDLLNVYTSPHAERPPWRKVEGRRGYDVYEASAGAALVCSVDLDGSVEADVERTQGSFLPNEAFAEPLKFKGQYGDPFITTSPLEVTVETIGGGALVP